MTNSSDGINGGSNREWGSWLEEMKNSALTEETRELANLYVEGDPQRVSGVLGWGNAARSLGSCLVFPYFGADGQALLYKRGHSQFRYARVKPEKPRIDRKKGDKPCKYESPRGEGNHAYLPPFELLHQALKKPTAQILITEGEKKTLCANQFGFPCIGLSGVWCFRESKGSPKLIPEMEGLDWNGRSVQICFDSDRVDKPEIKKAEAALAVMLRERGAKVRIVTLPRGSNGEKTGIDDFFVRGGTPEDFQRLLNDGKLFDDQSEAHFRRSPAADGSCIIDGLRITQNGFAFQEQQLVHVKKKYDEHGNVGIGQTTVLANFEATVIGETISDDGAERNRQFTVRVEKKGKQPLTFEVPQSEFDSLQWVRKHCPFKYILSSGRGNNDLIRNAVQELSPEEIPVRTVYNHTGWREIDSRWVWIHAKGGIGPDGTVESVETNLTGGLELYELPSPPTGRELREVIRSSMGLLDGLIRDEMSFLLWASVFRAPLGDTDFAVYIFGPTGAGKSEFTSLAQRHFGAKMERKKMPGSWASTPNALEGLTFAAKDALLTIDDMCPEGTPQESAKLFSAVDRIIRSIGNHSGRGRMNADLTVRPPRPPRSLVWITGEELPRQTSARARTMVAEFVYHEMNTDVLKKCQQDAANGIYAKCMAGYLQWMAKDYGAISAGLTAERETIRDQFVGKFAHTRTPEIVANLLLGIRYFLKFAIDSKAISSDEAKHLTERGERAIASLANRQKEVLTSSDPVKQFPTLIASALSAGRCHIKDMMDRTPTDPSARHWGWEEREVYAGKDSPSITNFSGLGESIGWVDGEYLYLDSNATFSVISKLLRDTGSSMNLSVQTYCKRLKEQKFLAKYDKEKTQTKVVVNDARRYVLAVRTSLVFGGQGQPANCDESTAENEISPGGISENPGEATGAEDREVAVKQTSPSAAEDATAKPKRKGKDKL